MRPRLRDGREAIDLLEALKQGRPYDAVIMDLTVRGGLGGKETIRRLKALDQNVRAIASSGYSTIRSWLITQATGLAVLVKPHTTSELAEALRACSRLDARGNRDSSGGSSAENRAMPLLRRKSDTWRSFVLYCYLVSRPGVSQPSQRRRPWFGRVLLI